jgi:hypothetical protein
MKFGILRAYFAIDGPSNLSYTKSTSAYRIVGTFGY